MVISCVLEEGKIEDGFQDSKEVATAANEGFTTTKKNLSSNERKQIEKLNPQVWREGDEERLD